MTNILARTALILGLTTAPAFATTLVYSDGRTAVVPAETNTVFEPRADLMAEGYELYNDPLTIADIEEAPLYSAITGEEIGEVEDTISDGEMLQFLVLDIGGFLGMGEKTINVRPDQVQVMRNPGLGDTRVYINATEEQLTELPAYEYQAADLGDRIVPANDGMLTDNAVDATTTSSVATGFATMRGAQVAAPVFGEAFVVDSAFQPEGFERYEGTYDGLLDEGSVEEAPLYSAITGEEIGEVEDALTENGVVTALVLDIGGFLGIGEHTITVRPDQVSYARDPGLLSDVRVYINATEEQLKAYPSYNADL